MRRIRTVRIAILTVIVAALAFAGCSSDSASPGSSATTSVAQTSSTPASETPAPARSGTPAANSYRAAEVFPQLDFERMLGLVPVPDAPGESVVLTQDGTIYRTTLADASAEPATFLDISNKIISPRGNEEGLLGLAFAPDYATSREFYIYYSAGPPRRSVISRFKTEGNVADPASEQILLEIPDPFPNHNGGQMVFGPNDGLLYIALGDGGSAGDPNKNGQNTNTLFAKILRIDVSGDAYTIPPDNPFAAGGGRGEAFAYGLRNPWRFTFDRDTGDIWAGDVGQSSKEEVDRIVRGGNYGWSITEGDECFRADTCDRSGLIEPRAAYGREGGNCSVTGGYVYRGPSMPELDGWYVYGDFCSGRVWAVDTTSDDSPPVVLFDSEKQISSFAEDTEGELYLVTFNNAIYRLEKS